MSATHTATAKSRLVVVSNRLPTHRTATLDAEGSYTSSGGLVSALQPVLSRVGGKWIGWVGQPNELRPPFDLDGIRNVPVALSQHEVDGFYNGFSNRTLWPLYHAVRRPRFERRWWKPYVMVNRRFAEYAAREAGEHAVVWIHDYHLQLVPQMLRQMRPDLRIGFFLHIPFPPQELFAQLPWRRQILEGLLGADLVGCHTIRCARNFAELAVRYAGAHIGEEDGGALVSRGHHVLYGAFPISIDFERFQELARSLPVRERARQIRAELGEQRRLILGIDRLDYTKGIDLRLRAYAGLLDRGRVSPETSVLVQIAVPSREDVPEYVSLRRRVEALVGRVNGRHSRIDRVAVHYLHRSLEPEELVAFYVAADIMLVTPLRDGMNLVAKEYAASRVGEDGVLILSEFTGAADELTAALMVNPHDQEAVALTIAEALAMSADEARARMKRLRAQVASHDVHRWARDFLGALGAGQVEAGAA